MSYNRHIKRIHYKSSDEKMRLLNLIHKLRVLKYIIIGPTLAVLQLIRCLTVYRIINI